VTGNVDHRAHQVLTQLVEAGSQVGDREPPAAAVRAHACHGLLDRSIQHPGGAVVERVRAVDLGPFPGQPITAEVDLRPERWTHSHRMSSRAVIVDDARHGQLS
jgi:hypothetical protein